MYNFFKHNKEKEKKPDRNFLHILRDLVEIKKFRPYGTHGIHMTPPDKPGTPKKFETSSIKPMGNDYEKRAKEALSSVRSAASKSGPDAKENAPLAPPSQPMTSENYRQVYARQKAFEAEAAKKNAKSFGGSQAENMAKERLMKEQAEKRVLEEKQANNYRFRARELQNQIHWWKNQKGMGQYDDSVINGTIFTLEQELNGIPSAFWT